MTRSSLICALLCLLLSLPAFAQKPIPLPMLPVDIPLKQNIIDILDHKSPNPSPKQWQKMPDDTVKVLEFVVTDSSQFLERRKQALIALKNFSERGGTFSFYANIIRGRHISSSFVQRSAIEIAAPIYGERLTEALGKALDAKDTLTREAAIQALAKIKTDESTSLLKAHKYIEWVPTLIDTLNRALAKR